MGSFEGGILKKKVLKKADRAILAFGDAQGEATKATKLMWSALIPLVVEVVKTESKKPGYKHGVPRDVIVEQVSEMFRRHYRTDKEKNKLPENRHIADGMVILAVNGDIIPGAVQWALACEFLCKTAHRNRYLCVRHA